MTDNRPTTGTPKPWPPEDAPAGNISVSALLRASSPFAKLAVIDGRMIGMSPDEMRKAVSILRAVLDEFQSAPELGVPFK